jgi:hypothetical protein
VQLGDGYCDDTEVVIGHGCCLDGCYVNMAESAGLYSAVRCSSFERSVTRSETSETLHVSAT